MGLWRGLRWVKLLLLIQRGRDDGIEFFIRRGPVIPSIPGLSSASLRPPLRASDSRHQRPLPSAAGSYCAPRNGRGPPLLHLELSKPSRAMYIPRATGPEGTRTRRNQQPATGRQSDAQSQWARFSCTGSIGRACITRPRKSGPTNSSRRTPFQHGRTDRSAHGASLRPM